MNHIIEPHRLSFYEAEQLQAEIDYYENVALHYRREARKAVWQGRVKAFGILTASMAIGQGKATFRTIGEAKAALIARCQQVSA